MSHASRGGRPNLHASLRVELAHSSHPLQVPDLTFSRWQQAGPGYEAAGPRATNGASGRSQLIDLADVIEFVEGLLRMRVHLSQSIDISWHSSSAGRDSQDV